MRAHTPSSRNPAAGLDMPPAGWLQRSRVVVLRSVVLRAVVALATLGAAGCGGGPSVEQICAHIADVTLAEVGSEDEAMRNDTLRACMESFEGRRVNGRTGSCVLRGESLADVNRCVH